MRVNSNSRARIIVFSLAFLLISTLQVCLTFAEKIDNISNPVKWSPARKSRFFKTASYHARTSGPSSQMAGIHPKNDDFYDEEKRLIHTGPNPLHN
ncbi:Clavata3/esr-related 16 [Dorcoceras hygrometricum]|uniref:Clavata3/esr-related 16 n=1 Tax=Dorcoceras hygrometricum TaxID=472368 RepID=A0A2Z7AD54_9LAMI|nr:Clavata3/esr-related 16 [Dorcoceras hygrometricum]